MADSWLRKGVAADRAAVAEKAARCGVRSIREAERPTIGHLDDLFVGRVRTRFSTAAAIEEELASAAFERASGHHHGLARAVLLGGGAQIC
jgi:alanine dehydrogenase